MPHNSKVKSHLKFTELDINASQACILLLLNSTEMGEGFHTAIKNQTYTVQTHGKNMTDVYG